MGEMQAFLTFVAVLFVYMLPAFVAGLRNHRNTAPITVITVFLGWTLIGWVAALAWSLSDQAEAGESKGEHHG